VPNFSARIVNTEGPGPQAAEEGHRGRPGARGVRVLLGERKKDGRDPLTSGTTLPRLKAVRRNVPGEPISVRGEDGASGFPAV
jgi:hypothetical protein